MLEVGMILKFIPPYYADGKHNDERTKRFMLIISINYEEGILVLINISKVDGKPDCLTYDYNKLIKKYNPPLPLMSFAKLNGRYLVENYDGIERFLYKNGEKIDENELRKILEEYENPSSNYCINQITITKAEIEAYNSII